MHAICTGTRAGRPLTVFNASDFLQALLLVSIAVSFTRFLRRKKKQKTSMVESNRNPYTLDLDLKFTTT